MNYLTERKAKKALEAASRYYEDNRTGLTLFDAAERYLRVHLQSHFDPKITPADYNVGERTRR